MGQVENGKAQAANFPFCTIEPNVGVVAVPDPRLEVLSTLSKSQKIVPTSVEFVDIAGLVKGASQGEVCLLYLYFTDGLIHLMLYVYMSLLLNGLTAAMKCFFELQIGDAFL